MQNMVLVSMKFSGEQQPEAGNHCVGFKNFNEVFMSLAIILLVLISLMEEQCDYRNK